ncbi:MAG: peptidoglycan-binding protein [Clostridia bacterium]|nr:peptidoglycan-binding protein [Clostridia bacterium]
MLKRKFLAILLLACLAATTVAVPGAMATSFTNAVATVNGNSITVTVSGGADGETLTFVWSGTTETRAWSSTGSYTFASMPNGSGVVTITSPSGGTITSNSVTVGPTTVDISITVTNNGINTITLGGKAKPNAGVNLMINNAFQETKAADGSGNFSFAWSTSTAGDYTVSVVYANGPADGNSATWGSTIKLTGPLGLSDLTASLIGDGLNVSGKGVANGNILITVGGRPGITASINASGVFQEVITLPPGTYTSVEVRYNGISSTYGSPQSVDITGASWVVTAPGANDITITNVQPGVNSIVVDGKGKAGEAVTARVGTYSGSAVIGSGGTFKITISSMLAGTYTGASVTYNNAGVGNGASTSSKYTVTDGGTTPPGGTYPTLSRGMVNAYVTTLQLYLRDLGYYTIRVDGIFGVGTETAVRNFQIMNNLPATGIANDATQKLLYSGNAIGIGGTGVTPPSGYTTLRHGSRGTAVRNMQVRLANLGYYLGAIDGIFGNQTEAAVRQFQNRNNLAVTGIADSSTQTAIYSSSALPNGNASTGYVYLQFGSRGQAVVRLQTALKNAGYNPGPIDGIYGSQTVAAVKAFQRARGLVVDGIAGRKTQNALYGTNY